MLNTAVFSNWLKSQFLTATNLRYLPFTLLVGKYSSNI